MNSRGARDERYNILQFLMNIATKLPHVKIFITSRRKSDIVDNFESGKALTIKSEAERVAANIELFVKDEIRRPRKGQDGK